MLTLVNLINDFGYRIDIKNILYGKNRRALNDAFVFDDRIASLFNIEVDNSGEVFSLKDLNIFRNKEYENLSSLKSKFSRMPNRLFNLNDRLTKLNPGRQTMANQYDNLTLTVYDQNSIKKYVYDDKLGVIDKEKIKDQVIIESAINKPHLLAHLLVSGLLDVNYLIEDFSILHMAVIQQNLKSARVSHFDL